MTFSFNMIYCLIPFLSILIIVFAILTLAIFYTLLTRMKTSAIPFNTIAISAITGQYLNLFFNFLFKYFLTLRFLLLWFNLCILILGLLLNLLFVYFAAKLFPSFNFTTLASHKLGLLW